MMRLNPALQTSQGRSVPWSGSHLMNMYAERSEGDQLTEYATMVVPGLDLLATIGTGPIRGVHRMGTVLYVVSGAAVYSVSSSWVPTLIGVVLGTLPVQMANNGTQIAIVAGATNTTGYVIDSGIVLTPAALPPVSSVIYIDGYFLWTIAGGDQFIISALDDGLSYDALDVATVEGDPDALVGVINSHREVLFFGADTTEIWYNSGDADFPFARQGNAFIERGCIDRNSAVKLDSTVYFVGDDKVVYRLDGYTPIRVSTHSIEYRIGGGTRFRGFTYTQEGHKFYVLSTDQCTLVYDVATGAWAERQSYELVNYRVGVACTAYGDTIMGDATTGAIYRPDLDKFTENGAPIVAYVEIPQLEKRRELGTLYAIELYAETGVGNALDADPQAIMQYSRDGGRVWSNELSRSLGAVGAYQTRAVWRVNVQFRSLSVRFIMPSVSRRFVMGFFADVR